MFDLQKHQLAWPWRSICLYFQCMMSLKYNKSSQLIIELSLKVKCKKLF